MNKNNPKGHTENVILVISQKNIVDFHFIFFGVIF